MDDNTAAVLALLIMAGTIVAVVWLVCTVRVRVRRQELRDLREHGPLTEDLTWPDGLRVRGPGEKRLDR